MISPCKECTMRRQGCHAGCRLYLDWAKAERQLKERDKERRAIENGVIRDHESQDAKTGPEKEGEMDMIKDFMAYKPSMEELVNMELRKLWPNEQGFRLDINSSGIREKLGQYRRIMGIPVADPLSDQERKDFERWYVQEEIVKKDRRPIEPGVCLFWENFREHIGVVCYKMTISL